MKRFNYLAYGSNMDTARMMARCPGARLVGVARLRGYRLVERLYADIEPAEGRSVRGVLWSVTEADVASLDRHEGVAAGVYRRGVYAVEFAGRTLGAYCYEMTDRTRLERDGAAYPPWYEAVCRRGAAAHGVGGHFGHAKGKKRRITRIPEE